MKMIKIEGTMEEIKKQLNDILFKSIDPKAKYAFLTPVKPVGEQEGYFLNLGISQMFHDYIAKPFKMGVELGEHVFICEVDEPVYLLDTADPICEKFVLEKMDIHQGEKTISFPTKFKLGVEEYFNMKIDNGEMFTKGYVYKGLMGSGPGPDINLDGPKIEG